MGGQAPRGTLILDFDSTLITRESLEVLLARARPDLADEIRGITAAGMEGRIPFRESLEKRLALARPTRAEVEALGREALTWITPGMEGGWGAWQLWLVSGGLAEALLPVAARLKIPRERVLATEARWSEDGELLGIEARDKPEQLRAHLVAMPRPRVLVGDGITDWEPFRDGLVDHFIAFTANVRRASVLAKGAPEAPSAAALRFILASC
ncbi:MAG TPA: haloacid dehalogenase-like hydrolase [Planctomycetota bacterium]|nr:haloacid dehalogenase-like hydrolase [Planctomycetota bacterium]